MQGKVEICGVNTSKLTVLSQKEMDALLRRAYQFLVERCQGQPVYRLGGDEFLVFITDIPERRTAERKAGQICRETPAVDFPDGSKQRISLSVGISFFPEDAKEYEELYRMADIALYQAKKQGKKIITDVPQRKKQCLIPMVQILPQKPLWERLTVL